jgi:hypothetical protein
MTEVRGLPAPPLQPVKSTSTCHVVHTHRPNIHPLPQPLTTATAISESCDPSIPIPRCICQHFSVWSITFYIPENWSALEVHSKATPSGNIPFRLKYKPKQGDGAPPHTVPHLGQTASIAPAHTAVMSRPRPRQALPFPEHSSPSPASNLSSASNTM